jgi:hypothetical protein
VQGALQELSRGLCRGTFVMHRGNFATHPANLNILARDWAIVLLGACQRPQTRLTCELASSLLVSLVA